MLKFLGIGAQKAGTSWLYEHLRLHPEITFPGGKEVHFWDKKSGLGIAWYRSIFSGHDLDGKACGDITPAYSILPLDTIRECHFHFPDARLIYLLRNPIERAWSAAKMELGWAGIGIDQASHQWFVDQFTSPDSLMRGDYETCLRNWLECYPREQLLVCLFEELTTAPRQFLEKCFRHIGVCGTRHDWTVDLKKPLHGGIRADLPPDLHSVLEGLYRPKIDSLQDYLGMTLAGWR